MVDLGSAPRTTQAPPPAALRGATPSPHPESPTHSESAAAPKSTVRRADWLILANDGPALRLAALAEGVGIVVVANRDAFAERLTADRPSLVILASPPAGPTELGLVARERRRRERLRAIVIDHAAAYQERLLALELGFDDALTSDISPAELAGRLELLTSRARSERSPRHLGISDGIELDQAARELRRDGSIVHVRPREYALLALLATHPGRVYSRRQLLDRVWGRDRAVDPRTVDVHVRWLRQKLEPDPDRPVHLVTVRGVGYRLDPAALTDR